MKKLLFFIGTALTANIPVSAQLAFPTMEYVDINNIRASALVHGDMWWNPADYSQQCFFPKGSKNSVGFVSTLWLSGYDGGGQLHVAAQTYRQDGNDYWPGPLDNTASLTYATSYQWARIWKVNRSDIQYFQSQSTHTKENTPDAILTWPAKGNTNARGNAGYALTVNNDMAPFTDVNKNGIYEPLLGDYPDVKGDQALWWVFSDNGPGHNNYISKTPLGVEVHVMAYAYNRGTTIDNVIYYEYSIINRSTNSYSNFRAGIHADLDLGYTFDDFIGFDSVHRMGIQYNGNNDDGAGGGHPVTSYGSSVPMVGMSLVSLPGDNGSNYVPAGSFTYYNNDNSSTGNPTSDTAVSNYMRSMFRYGQHVTNDYYGPGMASYAHGAGPNTNYVYTGDPGDNSQWSECAANNSPSDRRFILSSNDLSLAPGETKQFTMALIAVDSAGGCPATSFSKIKAAADKAWEVYHTPLLPNAVPVVTSSKLNIYPNPAHDHLIVENGINTHDATIVVYNILGQKMDIAITQNSDKSIVDLKKLPTGFYHITYNDGSTQKTDRFVKE